MSKPYRGAGVYAFRTRRPGLIGRIPLIGRHWAYVGETFAMERRKGEHLFGSTRYGKPPQPWSDLKPTRPLVIRLPGAPKWVLHTVETLFILLLWPVYNDRKNRWNPRRIPIYKARAQRAQRDAMGWSFNFRPTALGTLIAAGLLLWMVIR